MSFLVHTSIFKVNVGVAAHGYSRLSASNPTFRLAPVSSVFEGAETVSLRRRRRPAFQEENSDDTYPALDVLFDEHALKYLSKTTFKELGVLELTDLSYRFLDFGFLYVVARFEVNGSLEDPTTAPVTDISRCQKTLLADLRAGVGGSSLFKLLSGEGFIESTSSGHAGEASPDLLGTAAFDWDEHYSYDVHLFLIGPDVDVEAYKAAFSVVPHEAICFDDVNVFFSDNFPLWICDRNIADEELMYLLEADYLYLAEQTFHSSCLSSYQRILKQFVTTQDKSAPGKNIGPAVGLMRERLIFLSSNELRHILIRDKLALSQIAYRTEYCDADQNRYIRVSKQLYPLEQGYQIYKDVEETVKYVVHDQEQKAKEKSDIFVEIVLAAFAALTVLSVINDLSAFITQDKSVWPNVWRPIRYSGLMIVIGALFAVIYLHWKKRRGVR